MSKILEAKVELDQTKDALLGLEHAAEALPDLISKAIKDELAPHRFLDELLAIESHHREERRLRTSLRLSALPIGQTLANFDWRFQPDLDRRRAPVQYRVLIGVVCRPCGDVHTRFRSISSFGCGSK
jgi:DNA replication protein DnaC